MGIDNKGVIVLTGVKGENQGKGMGIPPQTGDILYIICFRQRE